MLYLSQMLGKPVVDASGEKIGTVSDLAISTGEVFPRITSLAFQGPGKVPFMISWRKYVAQCDDDGIGLAVDAVSCGCWAPRWARAASCAGCTPWWSARRWVAPSCCASAWTSR